MNAQTERRWPAVMVDLETLGTGDDAAIIEIAARAFDLEKREVGPGWSAKIALKSNVIEGREIDADTLLWWMDEWRNAGEVPSLRGGRELREALMELGHLMERHLVDGFEFWSRGSFDERILSHAMGSVRPVPWKFWKVRDQRTVLEWAGVPPTKAKHGALADVDLQIEDLFQAGLIAVMEEERRENPWLIGVFNGDWEKVGEATYEESVEVKLSHPLTAGSLASGAKVEIGSVILKRGADGAAVEEVAAWAEREMARVERFESRDGTMFSTARSSPAFSTGGILDRAALKPMPCEVAGMTEAREAGGVESGELRVEREQPPTGEPHSERADHDVPWFGTVKSEYAYGKEIARSVTSMEPPTVSRMRCPWCGATARCLVDGSLVPGCEHLVTSEGNVWACWGGLKAFLSGTPAEASAPSRHSPDARGVTTAPTEEAAGAQPSTLDTKP